MVLAHSFVCDPSNMTTLSFPITIPITVNHPMSRSRRPLANKNLILPTHIYGSLQQCMEHVVILRWKLTNPRTTRCCPARGPRLSQRSQQPRVKTRLGELADILIVDMCPMSNVPQQPYSLECFMLCVSSQHTLKLRRPWRYATPRDTRSVLEMGSK